MDNLRLCKRCVKQKFDKEQGVLCGLTNEKPNFIDDCPDFERDDNIKVYFKSPLRPNEQRAKIAIIFIWVILVIEFISIFSNILQYNLLQSVINGNFITNEELEQNDLREQIIGWLYLAASVISGITFIMWFRRAYFNLHQKVKNLSHGEGWASGSWFVPIISLYRPYQIMKELYVETEKLLKKRDLLHIENLSTKYLSIWWALWIISNLLGQIYFRYPTNTIQDISNATIVDFISSAIGIPLAIITIRIIKDYAKIEASIKDV